MRERSRKAKTDRPESLAAPEPRARGTVPAPRGHAEQPGRPVPPAVARSMERGFGHSFANVRVHDDAEGDRVARDFDARALTVGEQLFFRDGAFAPETPFGRRVLAHELAHVVQQTPAGAPPMELAHIDAAESAAEREAHAAAAAVSAGESARIVAGSVEVGTAQRWPWDDGDESATSDSPGVWDSLGSLASSVGSAVSSGASTALDWGNAAGSAISSAESAVWSGAKGAYGAVTGVYDAVAPNFTKSNQDLGGLVDMGEAAAKQGNAKMVAEYGDTPVLGSLVKGAAWLGDMTTDATGGVVKGVGDLAAMAGNAFFHPIDSALAMGEGALGIAEHVPLWPGVNTAVKGVHGLVDLASGKKDAQYGSTLGELGENLLLGTKQDPNDPSKRTSADLDFYAALGGGTKAWSEKPAEAATRTLVNLLPMLIGDEAAAGSKPAPGAAAPPRPAVSPLATTGELPAVRTTPAAAGAGALGEAAEAGAAGMKGKTLPPLGPNASTMEKLAWGVKQYEPGQIFHANPLPSPLPKTVFDHLPFGYEPPPALPFAKGYKLPVPYGELGLPVRPDGSLDLSKLLGG